MTREDIISMAREAGFRPYRIAEDRAIIERFAELVAAKEADARKAAQLETIAPREELTKRAMQSEKEAYQRGVRDEREMCAKVCESIYTNGDAAEGWLYIAADKIRARGEKGGCGMLTKQEVIALAMESGLAGVTDSAESLPVEYVEALAKFAGLSAKREREACAKIAESTVCDTHIPTGVKIYGRRAAEAIRNRKEEE